MVEMNIRNQRHGHRRLDLGQHSRRFVVRHGHADHFAPCSLQLANLLYRRRNIARVSRTHRLHGYRRVSADLDLANLNLPRFPSSDMHRVFVLLTFRVQQDAEKVRQQPQSVVSEARDMRERRDVDRLDFHLVSPVP